MFYNTILLYTVFPLLKYIMYYLLSKLFYRIHYTKHLLDEFIFRKDKYLSFDQNHKS